MSPPPLVNTAVTTCGNVVSGRASSTYTDPGGHIPVP